MEVSPRLTRLRMLAEDRLLSAEEREELKQLEQEEEAALRQQGGPAVCVDLDGTLTYTDQLHELLLSIARNAPWRLCALVMALRRGKAFFKQRAAELGTCDVKLLPYNPAVLAFLRARRAEGARLFLVTAADAQLAEAIAGHVGIFDGVYASDGLVNLSGPEKAARLAQVFGKGGFTYLGNSPKDLPVWAAAGEAVVVSRSASLRARARQACAKTQDLPGPPPFLQSLVGALRPHQWLKNALIVVPAITSHELGNKTHLAHLLAAAAAFSVTASAVYIVNDLLDLEHDRRHGRKRLRPWASGALPLTLAPVLVGALAAVAALLCTWLPAGFAVVLAAYVGCNALYSFWVKRWMLVDVFVLAALYTIRLVAGHVATGIPYSVWLFMFSMFVFLSLALMKRVAEVSGQRRSEPEPARQIAGRGYRTGDLEQLSILGTGCGLMAVLVMALYVTSPEVQILYSSPGLLLLACPLLLFWISRLWMVTHRGEMHDDPVVYTATDPLSYLVAAGLALIILAAKFSTHFLRA